MATTVGAAQAAPERGAPRPQPRPANSPSAPGAANINRAPNWSVGSSDPKDTFNLGRSFFNALRRGVPVATVLSLFAPSELGDGTLTDDAARQAEEDFNEWLTRNADAPEIAPPLEHFEAPRPGEIEFRPGATIDPFTPAIMPNALPEIEFDTVPEVPTALPGQPAPPARPPNRVDPARPPKRPRGPKTKPAPSTSMEVKFYPDGKVRVQQRKEPARWERRRRDSKVKKWYVIALRTINQTWGTYDEARQLAEAIAWNTYTADGKLAMNQVGRSQLRTFQGIGRGEFTVDIAGAIVDYSIAQAMDLAIGLSNKHGYQGSMPVGISSGPWDTAMNRINNSLFDEPGQNIPGFWEGRNEGN